MISINHIYLKRILDHLIMVNGNDFDYNLYIFDKRCQKNLESAQSINVELSLSKNIPAGKSGYALALTNKLVSISSDGQRHFVLV